MQYQEITRIETFLGDAKHPFQLTAPMIIELERLTGSGIGTIAKRMFTQDYRLTEVTETIRLGLIGGGMDPKRAKEMIEAYVDNRPIGDSINVALTVMNATFFGEVTRINPPQEPA